MLLLPVGTPRHVEGSHGFDGNGQRPAQPDDFASLSNLLNSTEIELRPGEPSRYAISTIVATGNVADEVFRTVWNVLTGKRNRSLQLVSLVIKTARK